MAGYTPAAPPGPGAMDQNRLTPIVTIVDGTSTTLLFGEMSGRPNLYMGRAVVGDVNGAVADKDRVDFLWANSDHKIQVKGSTSTGDQLPDASAGIIYSGEPCVINCRNYTETDFSKAPAEAFSFHAGGANFVFADGSVRFLSDKTTGQMLVYMVTARGSEVVTDN